MKRPDPKENLPRRNYIAESVNIENDMMMLSAFFGETENFQKWVVTKMRQLRKEAPIQERECAQYLFEQGYRFIAQAPFLIRRTDGTKKCYFADFYLPNEGIVLELDGISHQEEGAAEYDAQRDRDFNSINLWTIRIPYKAIPHGFGSIPRRNPDAVCYKIRDMLKMPFAQLAPDKKVQYRGDRDNSEGWRREDFLPAWQGHIEKPEKEPNPGSFAELIEQAKTEKERGWLEDIARNGGYGIAPTEEVVEVPRREKKPKQPEKVYDYSVLVFVKPVITRKKIIRIIAIWEGNIPSDDKRVYYKREICEWTGGSVPWVIVDMLEFIASKMKRRHSVWIEIHAPYGDREIYKIISDGETPRHNSIFFEKKNFERIQRLKESLAGCTMPCAERYYYRDHGLAKCLPESQKLVHYFDEPRPDIEEGQMP